VGPVAPTPGPVGPTNPIGPVGPAAPADPVDPVVGIKLDIILCKTYYYNSIIYKVKKNQPQEFWIVNASNRDVMLSDLYLSVKAYCSVNLLDKKHYYYTWEQICKSVESGSIYNKRNKIFVRKNAPKIQRKTIQIDKNAFSPSREKSVYEIKEEKYEELNLSDEQFAEENLELIEK
jgi:hypothetical protein